MSCRLCRALLAGRVANLRDLGGLPAGDGQVVRRRRLLRSATLVHHDGAVLDELTATVGPGVYFDLRTDREVDRDGDATPLVARGWHWHRLPIQDVNPDGDDDEPPVVRYRRAMPQYVAAAPGHRLTDDFPLIDERVLDSLGLLNLVSFLESEFGIGVDDTEITPGHFGTLGDIQRYVADKRG